jgi:hypothetical protein
MNSYIHSANQTRQQYDVTSQVQCSVYYLVLPLILLGCCRRKNCELRNRNRCIYTISYNVTVVADLQYHLTVTVETDTGKVE